MNTRILTIAFSIGIEVLFAIVVFALIPDWVLTDEIRWLDFIVLTIINVVCLLNVIFPFVNLSDKSHKEVAGLGIRWTATGWYIALALLFMLGCIIYVWQTGEEGCSFGLQALVQGALLLLFLGGIIASNASMDKAKQVYVEEQRTKKGKADVKAALADLRNATESHRDIDPELKRRILDAVAEGRYLTPSYAPEAREADEAIILDCEALATGLTDFSLNKSIAEDRLFRLENDIRRRKRL